MTYAFEAGSWLAPHLGVMVVSALPLAAVVSAPVVPARLQRGQTELLARLTDIEQRLACTS